MTEEERKWAELPKDILDKIISCLYGEDVKLFHSVCRSWYEAEEYVFQKEHNPLVFPVPISQWLLHKQCSELTCQFIHPVYPNVRYAKNLFQQIHSNAISRHSKDGWLLMSSGKHSMFFFSPFPDKLIIHLTDLIWLFELDGATFTCAPTSSSSSSTTTCLVFAISCLVRTRVQIATIRLGNKRWKTNGYVNNIPFKPSYSNPVFHNQMFYCLSKEGHLGTYNPKKDEWTVLDKPLSPRKWEGKLACKWIYEAHLVKHEGKLLSLFMGDFGSWVLVLKLNETDMVWETVKTLGDCAMFVSVPTSFATKSVLPMMRNKIFFPWLHNNYPVFYSLETNTFRTYGTNLHEKNLYTTEIAEQIESCWIEPREIYCHEEGLDWLNVNETDDEEETDDEVDEEETDDEVDEEETDDEVDEETDEQTHDVSAEDESGGEDDSESSDRSNSEKWVENETNNNEEEDVAVVKRRIQSMNNLIHSPSVPFSPPHADSQLAGSKCASSCPPNAQSSPYLMFIHGKSNLIQSFYSIADGRLLKRMLPHLSGNTIHANHDGWAVVTSPNSNDDDSLSCFLLHLTSMEKILLPDLEEIYYRTCFLSSSPLKPECVVVFISLWDGDEERRSRIKLWRPTQEIWVEVVAQVFLIELIKCDGKIYGNTWLSGSLVMIDIHDKDVVVKHQIKTPCPVILGSIESRSFLLESCGDVFLVMELMLGESGDNRVRTLQVYKLIEDKITACMNWIRLSDIGDRAFFVHSQLKKFSCSASKAGLKGNSIYFTGSQRDAHVYRYSLSENRFYTSLPSPDVAFDIRQICWLMID